MFPHMSIHLCQNYLRKIDLLPHTIPVCMVATGQPALRVATFAVSGYRQSPQKAIDHLITHTFLNGTFRHNFCDPDCLPLILQIP